MVDVAAIAPQQVSPYVTEEVEEGTLLQQDDSVSTRVQLVSKARLASGHWEDLDRAFKTGEGVCQARLAYQQLNGAAPSETCSTALTHIQGARAMLSVFRVFTMLSQLPNLFKTDSGQTRSLLDIIIDIVILIPRCLTPIAWLNRIKAIDIGKHAANIGIAITACWAAVTTLCFISAIRDYIQEKNLDKLPQKVANLLSAFFDMLAIPWDSGFLFNNPVSALVGGIILGVSGFFYLVVQLMDHKVKAPVPKGQHYYNVVTAPAA